MKNMLEKYDKKLFYILGTIVVLLFSFIIILNAYNGFASDIPWHIEVMKKIQAFDISVETIQSMKYPHIFAYPLYHIITIFVNLFIREFKMSSAIVMIVANAATILIIRKFCREEVKKDDPKTLYLIDIFAIFSVIVMSISGILTDGKFYLPQGSPNNYHNPSSMVMRPFALLAFIEFLKIFRSYEQGENVKKKVLIFAVLLFLSTLVKPSFSLFFLIVAGIYSFFYLFKNFKENLMKIAIPLLLAVIPSIIVMIGQKWFIDTFEPSELSLHIQNVSSIFTFMNLRYYLSTGLLIVIPFAIGAYPKRKNHDLGYLLALAMYLLGLAVWFFTVQGIYSLSNYQWSFYFALYLMYVYSAIYILKSQSKLSIIWWVVYGVQAIFGILYIMYIITGNGYW